MYRINTDLKPDNLLVVLHMKIRAVLLERKGLGHFVQAAVIDRDSCGELDEEAVDGDPDDTIQDHEVVDCLVTESWKHPDVERVDEDRDYEHVLIGLKHNLWQLAHIIAQVAYRNMSR